MANKRPKPEEILGHIPAKMLYAHIENVGPHCVDRLRIEENRYNR